MIENKIPRSGQIDTDAIDFVAINRQFSTSKYGDVLKSNVRFMTFKPENTSHSEWERLLGADVNNFNHLKLSFELTKKFLDHCANPDSTWQGRVPKEAMFSPQEQSLLKFTAMVHDWGEAIIGDIPLPKKTKADEKKEMVALKELIHEILKEKNDENFCENIGRQVTNILSNPTTKLGRAFNAIEYVGYSRTGLRAWERAKTVDEPTKSHLEHMATEVIPHGLPKLVAYSEMYPPVDSFLKYHRENIDQILQKKDTLPFVVKDKLIWQTDLEIT